MNPHRIDLVTLRLLLAVAQSGSITRAAESQRLALGAASTRIRELEESLGVALLERHARGVRFTGAGETLLVHARTIERELGLLASEMGDFAAGASGHLRIAANASAIATRLPGDLAAFLQAHPRVRIALTENTSRDVQRLVVAGDADVGLFAGDATLEGLRLFPYGDDTLVVLAPAGATALGDSIAVERLLAEDLILLQEGGAIQQWLDAQAVRLGLQPRIRAQVKGFDAISQLVAAGLGLAVLPRQVAEHFRRQLPLHCCEIVGAPNRRPMHLCVKQSRPASPLVDQLIAFLGAGVAQD